jgi:hypothetical protein
VTASVPIVVPMLTSMSGWMAVRKMTNGIGRTTLTRMLTVMKTARLAMRLPGRVAYSTRPRARPSRPPATTEMLTM